MRVPSRTLACAEAASKDPRTVARRKLARVRGRARRSRYGHVPRARGRGRGRPVEHDDEEEDDGTSGRRNESPPQHLAAFAALGFSDDDETTSSASSLAWSSERRFQPEAVLVGLPEHVERLLHRRGQERAHVDEGLPSSFGLPQVVSRMTAVGEVPKADGERLRDVGWQADAVVRKSDDDRE